MDLVTFPSVLLLVNGLYLILAAVVPFDYAAFIGRSGVQLVAMDSRPVRLSTVGRGVILLALAAVMGVLFTEGRLLGWFIKLLHLYS